MTTDGTNRAAVARGRGGGSLRHQEGFLRGAIALFAILAIVCVCILDTLSVFTAHQTLGDQTRNAAKEAAVTFVQMGSEQAADQAATQYLSNHGSTLVKISSDHTNGANTYTVTAKRVAKTYVFHYFTKLPLVGHWFDRQLHPVVTGDNSG